MPRHSPAELRSFVKESKAAEEERQLLWRQILGTAASGKGLLHIQNPTKAQLDFLAAKGFEFGEIVKKSAATSDNELLDLKAELDMVMEEHSSVERQIEKSIERFEDELFSINASIREWVEVNKEVAFQASLEPWFGEELDDDDLVWDTDPEELRALHAHIEAVIGASHQTNKIKKLTVLKSLVNKQIQAGLRQVTNAASLQRRAGGLEAEMRSLREEIAFIERDEYCNVDETDATHWISWESICSPKNSTNCSDISLLGWVVSETGQSFIDAIDSLLVRKAQLGERTATFFIGEKASFDAFNSPHAAGSIRYSCDGTWISNRGPLAKGFVELMRASGYHASWKTMANDIDQVTVSWDK